MCIHILSSPFCLKNINFFSDAITFFLDGELHHSVLPSEGLQLGDTLGFSSQESIAWRDGTKLAPFDTEVCM